MQKYIQVAFESRGISIHVAPLCEWCKKRQSNDVDHVFGRGGKKQTLLNDPKNLIFLCRECHINKGGRERKEKAKEIVFSKLLPIYLQ